MEGTEDVPGNSWSEAGGLGWTLRKSFWYGLFADPSAAADGSLRSRPARFPLPSFSSLLDYWWRLLGAPVLTPTENPG